ncbi:MAG: nuclear transport factor 2 family protein [Leucobacter sp.]
MPAADAAEILGVIARYAHVIDNRDWEHLGSVFTPEFGFGASLDALASGDDFARLIESVRPYHPHYSTDTVLHRAGADPDTVRAWTKFLLVRSDGSVASGDYIDTLVRTPAGWRIRTRLFSRGNRPDSDPAGPSERSFGLATWLDQAYDPA